MVLNYLLLFVTSVYSQNLVSKSFDIRTETTRPRFTTLYKDHDGLIWTEPALILSLPEIFEKFIPSKVKIP